MEIQIKEAFDGIAMPEETSRKIRTAIKETVRPRRRYFLRFASAVAALLTVAVLAVNAEAVGQTLSSFWTSGLVWSNGTWIFPDEDEGNRPTQTALPWVEVVDDRVIFHAEGNAIDITDEISYDTAYIYTCTEAKGTIHYFCIGGTPDNLGWVEFTYHPTNAQLGGLGWKEGAGYNHWNQETQARYPWMNDVREKLNPPWPIPG